MNTTMQRTASVLALSTALFGLAACGSNSDGGMSAGDKKSSSSSTTSKTSSSSGNTMSNAAGGLVGPGCKAYAKQVPTGSGSVSGMAKDPVATAASNNPLLKTLTAAVSGKLNPKVNLVDALNGGQYTVFAPVDSAFAELPKATVKKLSTPAGADTLTSVLTYHVVKGQQSPSMVKGTDKTLEGGSVKVAGSGDNLTVNGANVICGGVKTANATVYLIDEVMMPKM